MREAFDRLIALLHAHTCVLGVFAKAKQADDPSAGRRARDRAGAFDWPELADKGRDGPFDVASHH